jgi:sterol desaturase/sphingolipid hydroxylase (fatty acid hydroxylase superfamily)
VPPTIPALLIAFAVLLLTFRLVELFRPPQKRLAILRRGFWTDFTYWAFTPLVTKTITRACVFVAIVPVALLIYGKLDKSLLLNGFGPASRLPLWMQVLLIPALGDFVGYWVHHAFHGRRLWYFHAVHHSSVELDWLSAVRLHPVNDALMLIAGTLPILAFGFSGGCGRHRLDAVVPLRQ